MIQLILAICLLVSGCITTGTGNLLPVPNSVIKVLSINLCASYMTSRQSRADKIISFCKAEKVDIILAQEGTTGLLQFNTIKYIAEQLGYSYAQVPAFGVPLFYGFNVGVISAYPISNSRAVGCQINGGDPIDKVPFPGSARGLLVSSGDINIMSSHLTIPVEQAEKEKQVKCLMDSLPSGVTIWGGDFNFNRADPAYPLIKLQEAVYSGPPMVDMVFCSGLCVLDSKLVFEDLQISDHCGVMVTLGR